MNTISNVASENAAKMVDELCKIMEEFKKGADQNTQEAISSQIDALVRFSESESLHMLDSTNTAETNEAISSEEEKALSDLEFTTNQYGLVLVVHEDAMKYLDAGGTFSVAGLGVVATGLGAIAVPLGIVAALFVAIIACFFGVMKLTDKGNGVYITETWVQLGIAAVWSTLIVASLGLIFLPVIGAIEDSIED